MKNQITLLLIALCVINLSWADPAGINTLAKCAGDRLLNAIDLSGLSTSISIPYSGTYNFDEDDCANVVDGKLTISIEIDVAAALGTSSYCYYTYDKVYDNPNRPQQFPNGACGHDSSTLDLCEVLALPGGLAAWQFVTEGACD